MRPVDLATLFYLVIITLLIVLFRHGVAGWGWYVVMHGAAAAAIVGLIRAAQDRRGWLGMLRHWYPPLIFFPLFAEMNELVNMIFPFWANPWLIQLDHALFGVHPTVWFERVATPALTELMVLFYLTYFLLIPAAALPLYLKNRRRQFDRLMFNTALAYYLSFVAFLFFPAVSPRVTLAHLQGGPLEGGFLLGVLHWIQGFGGIRGGAFPSSHVAVAFAILFSTHRYERKVFYVLLPFVLGLAVSTTYCRYHYAVDAIAGALVGLLAVSMGEKLFARWEQIRFSHEPGIAVPGKIPAYSNPYVESASVIGEKRRHHAGRNGSQTSGMQQEIE
jgi:membrane-associated phospholipid phosphatase